jgi:hypothetical protein
VLRASNPVVRLLLDGGGRAGFPGTPLKVAAHQHRAVQNFLVLRETWPDLSDAGCPFMPVLQGWEPGDYLRCWRTYAEAGVDLAAYPVVGLGPVCRRQAAPHVGRLVRSLTPALAIHPAPYYTTLQGCSTGDVPYTQLATDLADNTLPAFSLSPRRRSTTCTTAR